MPHPGDALEYEELLATRQSIEIRMATQDTDIEAYWRHRYASLQVQVIYDHLKVVLPTPPGTRPSANAIMRVHRMLSEGSAPAPRTDKA